MRVATFSICFSAFALISCVSPPSAEANTSQAVPAEAPAPAPPVIPTSGPSPSATPDAKPTTVALPADVVSFRAKRDECDHFRGEEPADEARADFLEKALARTCTGTDAALAALKKRYADQPAVMAVLSNYDEGIE